MKVTYVRSPRGLIQGEVETSNGDALTEFQFTPACRVVVLVDGLSDLEVAQALRAIATTIQDGAK